MDGMRCPQQCGGVQRGPVLHSAGDQWHPAGALRLSDGQRPVWVSVRNLHPERGKMQRLLEVLYWGGGGLQAGEVGLQVVVGVAAGWVGGCPNKVFKISTCLVQYI